MRLLDKEPARRYPDAASLITDLKAVKKILNPIPKARTHEQLSIQTEADENESNEDRVPSGEPPATKVAVVDDPPSPGYLKNDLITSKTFTAALGKVMQGMMFARKQQWKDAEEQYSAAVEMLTPLHHSSELARTYARLGALYCAKIKITGVALPSEVNAAREYISKALPILREKRLAVDVKDAEENLRSLDSLKAAP